MESDIIYARYAHAEGHTAGCFTLDGNYVITCGSDCDVRKWSCTGDDEGDDDGPSTITLRESATCIIFCNDTVYLGSGNFVETYKYPVFTCLNDRPLRFSAPVTDIDISSDGEILIAGSCDMKIKIKYLKTGEITELNGHTAPILRVILDPCKNFLATSSCDGSVKVWNIASNENIKTFDNVIPTNNDFFTAKSLGGPTWERQKGLYLAVINGCKVSIYSADKWSFQFELSSSKMSKLISLLSFSPCGTYLCAGTTIGEIAVWNFKTHCLVSFIEHPQKACISALSWNPNKMEIAYCDRLGRICIVSPKLEKAEGIQKDGFPVIGSEETNVDYISKDNYDSEDNENTISINHIKESTGYLMNLDDKSEGNEDDNEDLEEDYPVNPAPTVDLQKVFQPSSTPSYFQHGYMVWNSIGIVRSFNSEGEKSIDVEFHDTMLHHSIHRRNLQDYFMASLSSKILCLASSSVLTGILLNAWDEKKEWSITLPAEENILAVTASGNWVCCATDSNQLRFFTYTGTQRQVVSLSGPVVCMNSHEGKLVVITHNGLGLPECQNLGYLIFGVSDFLINALIPYQPVPLSPKSKLKWTGFTDEGTPCSYDSAGIIRLSRDLLHWEVVCDTRFHRKNQSDNYFLIGVSERLQSARCILCKGSWYPLTVPRPTVVEIPLKIPLCQPEENKTSLEDTFWRHVFSLPVVEDMAHENDEYKTDINNWEKILKQTIVKLFAEAYRDRSDMRAVNIASLMTEQTLKMAMRLVQSEGRVYLVDKLTNLSPKKWEDMRQDRLNNLGANYWKDDTKVKVNSLSRKDVMDKIKNVNHPRLSSKSSTTVEGGRKSEIKNKESQKSLQGDMFEDSQCLAETVRKFKLGIEKKNSPPVAVAPMPVVSEDSILEMIKFPFKEKKKDDGKLSGLAFFDSLKKSDYPIGGARVKAPEKIQVPTTKAMNVPVPREKPQPKKVSFVDWFKKEKIELQSKYPDLNYGELTKIAMKIFREEISQGNQKHKRDESLDSNKGSSESLPEAKRQKLEE